RIVLAHELAHVRHSDFLLHALGQLSVALHFYHPLVHWLARRLRLEQELAADTMAAQVTGGQQIYLMTLANIALAQPNIRVGWPAHAFLPTRGMFLRRIEMLRNKKYNPNPPGGFSMATQSIAFCLLAVAGLVVAGLRGTANEGSSESDSTSITAQDPRTFLEFHLAESNPRENLMKAILDHNKETVYLHKDPVLTGQHVTSAQVVNIDSNQPAVVVTFTEEGQQILKKVTTDHQGKRLAVLVDGKIVTAPTIRATISKVALITGNFDRAEAERIANFFFPTKRDARKTVDFSYIPEDAAWFFAVRPADMFKVKCFQPVLEMADAEMAITDGFSWSQIEQLSVVWTLVPAADLRTNSERTIVRVTPDVDLPSVHAALARMKTVHEPREETIAGTRIYVDSRSDQPSRPAYYVADAQTLVFDRYDRIVNLVRGDETAIDPEQITAIDDTQGALGIAYAQGSQFRVRILPELRRQAKDIPSGLAMLLPVVEKTDTGLLIARVNADLEITGTAVCPSAQDATGVAKAIESLISMMHHWIIARTEGPGGFEDAVGKGSSQDERSSGPTMFESQLVALSKVLVKNAHLTVVDKQAKMTTSCEPDLADLFVAMGPSIRKGREAARRALCINNLKQIALLFLLYENQMGSYPPAVFYGPDGKTPYSWRVAILPYLGAQEIYDQYKFDEPWDGPNNIKLLDKMPAIYRHPKDNSQSTNTSYFVLTGPETVFSSKEGVKLREVLDGTHFTLLVVEAKRDVPWTKPEDIPYASDQPLPELGGWQWSLGGPDGFCVARCDGSVDFLVEDRNDEAEFRAMITKAGGETIRSNSKVAPARNR
ncbi:MAG: DUF1559 domain-containing protein, partial [Pirellulales bacterium]|nr:DUF1559 domain-containing protein [Pirellulales bacterium]